MESITKLSYFYYCIKIKHSKCTTSLLWLQGVFHWNLGMLFWVLDEAY